MQLDNQFVGSTIRKLRKEKGMTQEFLSSFAGIARSHLAMIEIGTKHPNFETIWRIAQALNIPASDLVLEIEESHRHQEK